MALKTDQQVRAARLPDGKNKVKHSLGEGLMLVIISSGKYWTHEYVLDGKRREYRIGIYKPGTDRHITLKQARQAKAEAKELIHAGIDPTQHRKAIKQANIESVAKTKKQQNVVTFETVARKWLTVRMAEWVPRHASRQKRRLEKYIFDDLGDIEIGKVEKVQIVKVLQKIAETGHHETAQRVARIIRAVLEYALDAGLIDMLPIGNVSKILPKPQAKPMPALTDPKRIGELLRAIDQYDGHFVVCQALKLLPLVVLRSAEFRTALWNEIDFDKAIWTVPASHRKLKRQAKLDASKTHKVPLSKQAVAVLKDLRQYTGNGSHIMPSVRGDSRPMSENTINVALSAMGYKGIMCGHGWRASFSTIMNEMGFSTDAIELQLGHLDSNKVRAAYHRADHWNERVKLMQSWADYLEGLNHGAVIIPIGRSK